MNTHSYRFGPGALTLLATPSNTIYNFGKGDFTVEAWVSTLHGGPVLARKVTDGGPNHGGFFLTLELDKVIFTSDDGSYWNSTEGSASVCDGRWHHVAGVRTGQTAFLYVDGEALTITGSGNAYPPLSVNSIDRLTIGSIDQTAQPNRFFQGQLAEIRLWNKARSHGEILGDMFHRLQSGTLDDSLVGYWTGEFGYISDLSIHGNRTVSEGILSGSGEIPPLRSFEIETFSTIFYGIYNLTGTSSPFPLPKQLAITIEGSVILDGYQVIKASQIQGTRLTWQASGNNFGADLQFLTYSPGNDNQQFTGTFSQGASQIQVTGSLAPVQVGCGILLNVGTGLVLNCPNPVIGAQVYLATKNPNVHDQFCRCDSTVIQHMHSSLALKPDTATAGSKIVLKSLDIRNSQQSWVMNVEGNIIFKADPRFVLGASGGYPLLLPLDSSNQAQQWLSLRNSQVIFNGTGGVLDSSNNMVRVLPKADGAPAQLWYFFRNALIDNLTAKALTTNGNLNSTLSLSRWDPANTAQQFTINGTQLIHNATGGVVGVVSLGSQLTLFKPGTLDEGNIWSINSPVREPVASLTRHERDVSSTADTTTYTISVYTGDYIAAGTDDRVEIILKGDSGASLPIMELKNNTTGTNPFERGQNDTFVFYSLPNIGRITAVTIKYGANNWLWNDRWVVDQIVVTNSVAETKSYFSPKRYTAQFEMPSVATFYAEQIYHVDVGGCTMSLGMAPAQDPIGSKFGWHHTWVSVVNDGTPVIKTWFDCAGGHEGPGTINNVLTGRCSRQTVVRMSTGYPYSNQRPLREAYGTARTDGIDNANVRAEGRINWQGQCH